MISIRPIGISVLAVVALAACQQKSSEVSAQAPAAVETGPRLYVQGSSIHLRKEPSAQAESLEKLPIGTECVPLAPVQGEWHQVRCGAREGYASASLLSAEKPSLEKLEAQARDPKLPLTQRHDSALRAATLAPDNEALSKLLGELFFERNFEQLAALKKPLEDQKYDYPCIEMPVADCILRSGGFIPGTQRKAITKGRAFVAAFGHSEQIALYRGRFKHDKQYQSITVEVLERTSFTPTPVLATAIFSGAEPAPPEAGDPGPRLGQLVLDGPAQAIIGELPSERHLLKRAEEGPHPVHIKECNQQPYALVLSLDLHGRWSVMIDTPEAPLTEERWVSSVAQTDTHTRVTIVKSVGDPQPQVLEIPVDESLPATLGEALYHYRTQERPEHIEACGGGEAAAGPSFSGEFTPEKAMAVLYGNFDAEAKGSRWFASGPERTRADGFNGFNFSSTAFLALPWKWASYRQGEQEKVLFLTETRSRESFHSATALIGGGLFTRVGESWRLELADRAITAVGSMGAAPGFDISVQSAGERGFIAILTDGSTHMGSTVTWLVLLSDTGVREQRIGVVGRVEDASADSGSCPSGEGEEGESAGIGQCFSYDSKWKLVPNPERALPDLVVTTAGTHLGGGKRPQVESFHKVRTFSVSPAGEYSESRW